MDKVASQLIDVAIATLRRNVVPTIASDAGRTYADLLTRLLRLVSARLSSQEASLQRLTAASKALTATAPIANGATVDLRDYAVVASGNKPLEAAQRLTDQAQERLAAAIPNVMSAASAGDDDGAALAWLEAVVREQELYFTAMDPDVRKGAQVAYRGGRIDDEELATELGHTAATPDLLTSYFSTRLGDPDIAVGSVDVVPGGFSKTTYLVDLASGSVNGATGVVIRQDPLVPYNCKTIIEEYDLLIRLHGAGYPIAEPLLIEEDRSILGSPFALSRRVPGSGNVAEWSQTGEIEPFAKMLAETLARLHAIPLSSLEYGPEVSNLSAGEHMKLEIDRWQQLMDRKKRRPYPLNTLMMSWLRENIPSKAFATRASVVHGDVGFHNLLVADGRLTAILDWEYSHFGDAVEDMVFVKPFMDKLFDWQAFKHFYYDAGGAEITPEDEAYYSIWPGARNSISCVDAVSVVETALPNELKYLVSGYILMPYVQLEACKSVLSELVGRRSEKRAPVIAR